MCHYHWKTLIDCGLSTCVKSKSCKPPIPETKPEVFDYWIAKFKCDVEGANREMVRVVQEYERRTTAIKEAIASHTAEQQAWQEKKENWLKEQQSMREMEAEIARQREQARIELASLEDVRIKKMIELVYGSAPPPPKP